MPLMKNAGSGPGDDNHVRRLPPSSAKDKDKGKQKFAIRKHKRLDRDQMEA